ncbi:MAG TPA: glycosyltransferase family 39 protein [Bacteroidota bacterium]|jgi:4-amino-4-deoxy-L-arabinose transferase-like glycosyltransferase|nr:glycosyltransferase family 39 protein [Bacteroidota bacterium]
MPSPCVPSGPDTRLSLLPGLILLLGATIIFSKLGGHGLANYDDCFYAQKAKEILETGDWLTMHFNRQPAWENPPFFIWMIALSYRIFGVGEFAAKFPSAFFGLATILLVYHIAGKLYNAWTAFFSSLVLSTTFIFTRYARHAMMDVTLSFFVCLALYAASLALEKDRRYFLLWGASIGICILIKSVLGFVPLVITVFHFLLTGRRNVLVDRFFLLGSLIMLAGCSWYIDQYVKFGRQFFDGHFGWVIYTRAFGLGTQAWYDHLSYLVDLLTYYWPWLPLFIAGVVMLTSNALKGDKNSVLLVLWAVLPIMVLSLVQSRVLWYIMPVFPAAAIICGWTLDAIFREQWKILAAKICLVLTVGAFIALNFTPVQVESDRELDVREIAPYVRHFSHKGARLIAYRWDYYSLNNALLFYSDYGANPIFEDMRSLSAAFAEDTLVLCVMSPSDLEEAASSVKSFHVLRRTNEMALAANRELNAGEVGAP